jgi:hypothetical protein
MTLEINSGGIFWGYKLHLDTAEIVVDESIGLPGHKMFRVQGKERPAIILAEKANKRCGRRQFVVVFLTTKSCDSRGVRRTDLVPFSYFEGQASFVELPESVLPENLISRFKEKIYEGEFRALRAIICKRAMAR